MDNRTAGLLLVLSCLIGIFIGIFIGIGISYFVAVEGLKEIGDSFQIQSMNVTVQLNQTMLMEAMREAVNNSRMP